jgi:hypothetical protein
MAENAESVTAFFVKTALRFGNKPRKLVLNAEQLLAKIITIKT